MYQIFERPDVVDLWRRIPDHKQYEVNMNGEVRDYQTKRIIPPINEHGVYIRLKNNLGQLKTKRVQDLRNVAFYPRNPQEYEWHRRNDQAYLEGKSA